jgi:hypothetical protein
MSSLQNQRIECGSLSRIRRTSIGCLKKRLHAQAYPIDAADTLSHLGGLNDPAIIYISRARIPCTVEDSQEVTLPTSSTRFFGKKPSTDSDSEGARKRSVSFHSLKIKV